EKDLQKLTDLIRYFMGRPYSKNYPLQLQWAQNYSRDAVHYHEKGDYFSSFGCANYAYGILEGILLKEEGKTFHELGGK
ncbi:MAG: DUF357 domain-containing protein, partial [Candidatus ainarchaeum sp.]|nr:DUF357 domain-containing protein [Candidatus ainarchaeum sp.]